MRSLRFRPPKVVTTAAALVAIGALISQPVAAAVDDADQPQPPRDRPAANDPAAAAAYSLPLPKRALPRREYDDPHHDYPAIDLPAPRGTRAFAVTSGRVELFTDSGCGKGAQLTGDNGAVYTYCHLNRHFGAGRVGAGRLIGRTGNTGNSTGPHLHLQIKTNGTLRCPQRMLLAIYDGRRPPRPTRLPTGGCFFQTVNPQQPLGLS